MTDYIDLALKYGGFTRLDEVYLAHRLKDLTEPQKLAFITPPPSVINAYFAEIYQKQGASEATTYFFNLAKALQLFQDKPSFREEKPFIRLNLSGQSFGFTFLNDAENGIIFSEHEIDITDAILFELTQIFPHYLFTVEDGVILTQLLSIDETDAELITPDTALLTTISKLKSGWIKLSSLNQDELLELAQNYSGERYYTYKQREFIIYILEIGTR